MGAKIPATELELIKFWTFPVGEIVWHISKQVNVGLLAAYITVFDTMRGKCRRFINFLVYALIYLSISNNLATLATLSPWYDSVCTQT